MKAITHENNVFIKYMIYTSFWDPHEEKYEMCNEINHFLNFLS